MFGCLCNNWRVKIWWDKLFIIYEHEWCTHEIKEERKKEEREQWRWMLLTWMTWMSWASLKPVLISTVIFLRLSNSTAAVSIGSATNTFSNFLWTIMQWRERDNRCRRRVMRASINVRWRERTAHGDKWVCERELKSKSWEREITNGTENYREREGEGMCASHREDGEWTKL